MAKLYTKNSTYKPSMDAGVGSLMSAFHPLPDKHANTVKIALTKIEHEYVSNPKCNNAYRDDNPFGKWTLKQLMSEDIWIGYDPTNRWGGWTAQDREHFAIKAGTFTKGIDSVIHVILHEFAHVAGFPSESDGPEKIVCACGLKCMPGYFG